MTEIAGALIALAGVALIGVSLMPSEATERTRQRLAGIGFLFCGSGFLAWAACTVYAISRFK
jgi:hypothetical protein